jgi:hypothetical protein
MAPVRRNFDERPRSSISVEVFPYDTVLGVGTWWDDGAVVKAEVSDVPERIVIISGNREGLQSLARHLLTLAQSNMPDGCHLDFDTYSGWLDDGSAAIRIEVEHTMH